MIFPMNLLLSLNSNSAGWAKVLEALKNRRRAIFITFSLRQFSLSHKTELQHFIGEMNRTWVDPGGSEVQLWGASRRDRDLKG